MASRSVSLFQQQIQRLFINHDKSISRDFYRNLIFTFFSIIFLPLTAFSSSLDLRVHAMLERGSIKHLLLIYFRLNWLSVVKLWKVLYCGQIVIKIEAAHEFISWLTFSPILKSNLLTSVGFIHRFSFLFLSFSLLLNCDITNEIQFGLTNFSSFAFFRLIGSSDYWWGNSPAQCLKERVRGRKYVKRLCFVSFRRYNLKLISRSNIYVSECYKSNQLSTRFEHLRMFVCEMWYIIWKPLWAINLFAKDAFFASPFICTWLFYTQQRHDNLRKLLFYCRSDAITKIKYENMKNFYKLCNFYSSQFKYLRISSSTNCEAAEKI